jgi:hypothetical protein
VFLATNSMVQIKLLNYILSYEKCTTKEKRFNIASWRLEDVEVPYKDVICEPFLKRKS